jgi:hypothetical protein
MGETPFDPRFLPVSEEHSSPVSRFVHAVKKCFMLLYACLHVCWHMARMSCENEMDLQFFMPGECAIGIELIGGDA